MTGFQIKQQVLGFYSQAEMFFLTVDTRTMWQRMDCTAALNKRITIIFMYFEQGN